MKRVIVKLGRISSQKRKRILLEIKIYKMSRNVFRVMGRIEKNKELKFPFLHQDSNDEIYYKVRSVGENQKFFTLEVIGEMRADFHGIMQDLESQGVFVTNGSVDPKDGSLFEGKIDPISL